MNSSLKKFLNYPGMIFVIEIILILLVYFSVKWYTQQGLVNDIPPAFEATLLGGGSINQTVLRNKPVLLHFWASWCPVCKLEQDSIESISQDHQVIGVAMNSGTDLDISHYLQQHNLSFPNIVDPQGVLAEKFGVRGVPISFIINPDGEIAFIEKGFTTEYGLRLRLWLANF